jgi:hypothetical protein
MKNPFTNFGTTGKRLTDIFCKAKAIPDSQFAEFITNQKRLEFLRNLISRVEVLAYDYDSLCKLTDKIRDCDNKIYAVPTESGQPGVITTSKKLANERDQFLIEADAFISLIYYEVTSVVSMLRQLGIPLDIAPEVLFLVKVRDRFLSHVRLSGVGPKSRRGYALQENGLVRLDVVALSSWSYDEVLMLGNRSLEIGSPEWHEQWDEQWDEQRERNEELILSKKKNEDFTQDDITNLMAAGVRECELELALNQLGSLLEIHVLPIIEQESDKAIQRFKCILC